MNTLKWIYTLGEKHMRERFLSDLYSAAQYHRMLSEIVALRKQCADKDDHMQYQYLSAQEHGVVARELSAFADNFNQKWVK